MDVLGLGLYYEDLPKGHSFKTIGRTITETDIINFVTCTHDGSAVHRFRIPGEGTGQGRGARRPGLHLHGGTFDPVPCKATGFAFFNMDLEVKALDRRRHHPCGGRSHRVPPLEILPQPRHRARHAQRSSKPAREVVMIYTPARMVKARTDGREQVA